jgi:predicted RNase H-like HicB family nuclease
MATSTGRDGDREPGDAIRLLKNPDGAWTAIDEDTGVASQGDTRTDALDNLDEAVALHTNDATEPLDNEDEVLEELGIEPDAVNSAREMDRGLPDHME